MRYRLLAILIVLACCVGCITQQTTKNEADPKVVKSRTIWIWEKDFWSRK